MEEKDEALAFETETETEPETKDKVEEGESQKEVSESKGQSAKENHKFKEMRLSKEGKSGSQNDVSYLRGKIDALGGKNTYLNTDLESEEDVSLYQSMKKLESEGNDPMGALQERYKTDLENRKKAKAEETSKLEKQKQMDIQLEEFRKEIPDSNERENLLQDEDFKGIYNDFVAHGGSLAQAAKSYKNLKARLQKDAELSYQAKIKSSSSPSPNMSKGTSVKSAKDMSDDEVRIAFEKKYGSY